MLQGHHVCPVKQTWHCSVSTPPRCASEVASHEVDGADGFGAAVVDGAVVDGVAVTVVDGVAAAVLPQNLYAGAYILQVDSLQSG